MSNLFHGALNKPSCYFISKNSWNIIKTGVFYFEAFQMIGDAIGREKQLKAGNRTKKVSLIERINPEWLDLYEKVKREFGYEEEE